MHCFLVVIRYYHFSVIKYCAWTNSSQVQVAAKQNLFMEEFKRFWNSVMFRAYKNLTCCIVFDIAAVGTVLFETRFGSFSKSPSLEATKFIDSAHRSFRLFLKFVLFPAWIDKFYRFKSVQEFYDHMDIMHNFGDMCINKKMREIQGRLDKEDIQDEDAAEFLTFLISREDISFKEIISNLIELLFPAIETVCISWRV